MQDQELKVGGNLDGWRGGEGNLRTVRLRYRGKNKSDVFIVGVRLGKKIAEYKLLYMV